jgi:hypothetical protein
MRAYILTALISLGVGAGAGWYFAPGPEAPTETLATGTKATLRKIRRVRVRKTTKPDGTHIDERTVTQSDTDEHVTTVTQTVTAPAPRWNASILGGANLQNLQPVLGAQINYRVAGPFTAGGWALTSPQSGFWAAGLSLGVTW